MQLKQDWDGVYRDTIAVETRSINVERRSVDVIASTDTLDSHGDILEQNWDLRRFAKNSPLLWNHNQFYATGGARPEDLLPLGRCENTRVEGGKLLSTLVFEKADVRPLAETVFRMFQSGTLRAVSVGFKPGKVTEELKNGRRVFRFSENELREISVVVMGSNPDAVAKSADEAQRAGLALLAHGDDGSRGLLDEVERRVELSLGARSAEDIERVGPNDPGADICATAIRALDAPDVAGLIARELTR